MILWSSFALAGGPRHGRCSSNCRPASNHPWFWPSEPTTIVVLPYEPVANSSPLGVWHSRSSKSKTHSESKVHTLVCDPTGRCGAKCRSSAPPQPRSGRRSSLSPKAPTVVGATSRLRRSLARAPVSSPSPTHAPSSGLVQTPAYSIKPPSVHCPADTYTGPHARLKICATQADILWKPRQESGSSTPWQAC